jgi:hypothetical protein
MTDNPTPDDVIESIEQQTPDDTVPLADDLDRSIQQIAEDFEFSEDGGLNGVSPQQGLAMLRPMIKAKTTMNPETALRNLAIVHLETGALIDKHSDTDATDLVR